jgi:hypothetical protein
VPDTTAPWRYFPLHLGDEWQSQVEVQLPNACIPACHYAERRVVTDTVIIEGRTYFRLLVRTYDVPGMPNPPPDSTSRYFRFDTAAAAPVHYVSQDWYFDGGGCRLDEAFPGPADSASGRPITCPSGPGTVFGAPASAGSIFGAEKAFTYFTFGWQWAQYQAGLGLLRGGGCEGGCYEEVLAYARVAGMEFGAPIIVGTEDGPGVSGPLRLIASPNPTDGVFTLAIRAGVAGPLTVEAFDILGRRVHRERVEGHAGAQAVRLDASSWVSGVYVVRAATSAMSATTVIVRR